MPEKPGLEVRLNIMICTTKWDDEHTQPLLHESLPPPSSRGVQDDGDA